MSGEDDIRAVPIVPFEAAPAPGTNEAFELQLANLPKNDTGNARRFVARNGADFIYLREAGWYGWDGARWDFGNGDALARLAAQRIAPAVKCEATALQGAEPEQSPGEPKKSYQRRLAQHGERVAKHFAWSIQTGNAAKLSALLGEASPHLRREQDELDCARYLFNAADCTLELGPVQAGDLPPEIRRRPHDRRDLLTRISPVIHDPNATAPQWQKFLDLILPPEIQRFLQDFFGYCLTGDISEQVLLLLQGEGNDGKSTLLDAISWVLGDFAVEIPINSLLANTFGKSGSDATPELARLPGARFARANEPPMGAALDDGIIKKLTGERKLTVRHLNRGFFEFGPSFKLAIACNRKPTIRADDDGTWRRFLVVPFERKIENVDKNFFDTKLVPEGPAILNWLLEGYKRWRQNGLDVPPAVRSATDGYRADSDPLGEWFEASVTVTKQPLDIIEAKELRQDYVRWCEDNGHEPLNATAFGRRIATRRGVTKKKSGIVKYAGIRLKRKPVPTESPGNEADA